MSLTGRRGLTVTTLACAAAAAVVLLAATRGWQEVLTQRVAPLPPTVTHRSGTDLAPWLPALGVVALAAAGALLATRGAARRVVGALLVLAGSGIATAALLALGDGVTWGWPVLCALGGLVVAAAGAVTVRQGGGWPSMGARYERPVKEHKPQETALWDALDRGEDPTV